MILLIFTLIMFEATVARSSLDETDRIVGSLTPYTIYSYLRKIRQSPDVFLDISDITRSLVDDIYSRRCY